MCGRNAITQSLKNKTRCSLLPQMDIMYQCSQSAEAQSITFRLMLSELKTFQEVDNVDTAIADDGAAKDSAG